MKKLNKLSSSQIQKIEQIKSKWINHYLNSGYETNYEKLRPLIDWTYQKAGLKSKPFIFIADGYFSQKIMINYIIQYLKMDLFDTLKIAGQITNQVASQVTNQVRSQKLQFIEQWFGVWNAGWLSFYDYFDEINIIENKEFTNYKTLQLEGFSIVLFELFVVICKMPKKTLRDDSNRLHSVSDAAIQWRDNQNQYFIHGVNFEKKLWDKVSERKLTAKQVLGIKNIEQRFATIRHYGMDAIFDELDYTLLDKSKRGNELYSIKGINPEKSVLYLKYNDISPTGRIFVKGIPDTDDLGEKITSADQAQAWSHHMTLQQYNNLRVES